MLKKIFSLLILLLAGGSLFAGPIEDLLKKTGSAADYPGSNVLIVFDSTTVDVQPSGLSYFYSHQLIKILTADGALQQRVIVYGYDPLSAFVEFRKVKVYRGTGNVEELNLKKVLDYAAPARAIYWGAREIMIEIGRLEPGDAVEVEMFKKGYTYALLEQNDDEKYIPPMRGHFYDIVPFWSDNPIIEKVYKTIVPEDKPMQFEFYHGECQTKVRFEKGKQVYTFSKKNILPIKREANMVDISDIAPKLLLSTSPDWEAKSLWFYGVNEDYGSFVPTPEVKAKVDTLLKGAKTENDSISVLTHWVADNMRYSGISMGPGEGYTLHNARMNFTDRCGVCKDKASLLISFLRAAGFKSYPAMTMAGSRIEDIPADQFNHSVTVVKLRDGKYHLLDPTWVPFVRELWSSAEQQQNYLMGVPGGADLGITPVSPPENHYIKINGTSELKADGSLQGEFSVTAEGQTDAAVRGIFTRNFKNDWEANLRAELLRINPKAEIVSMEFGDDPINYISGPILIKIKYRIPDYALVGKDEILFIPLTANNLFGRYMGHLGLNTSMTERKFGFRDRCSRFVEIKETVKIPDGYKTLTLDNQIENKGKAASYKGSVTQDGDKITMKQTVVLNKRVYQPEDWKDVKAAVDAQKTMATTPLILTK